MTAVGLSELRGKADFGLVLGRVVGIGITARMADEIDKANERAQELLDEALAKRKPAGPVPCGACHFCSEPLSPNEPFCGPECRDDWERLQVVERGKTGRYYDEKEKE